MVSGASAVESFGEEQAILLRPHIGHQERHSSLLLIFKGKRDIILGPNMSDSGLGKDLFVK